MRTSAIAVALVALATLVSLVSAEDDFSALLADLSFGDTPSMSGPPNDPLIVTEDASLKPAPSGMLMPGMVDTPTQEPAPEFAAAPEPATAPEVEMTPQVALKDPVPAVTDDTLDHVDLDAAFALQAMQSSRTGVPSQVVGHVHSGCAQCDSNPCGCGSVCGDDCGQSGCDHGDAGIICRPRNKVNLPYSTLRQYFRSNACYTNVWDGYRQHCGAHHKHLHGECDCFKKQKYGEAFGGCGEVHGCETPRCQPQGCCESGCDR